MASPLPGHVLTLAEVISWLAWGECFTAQQFALADGAESGRGEIARCEQVLGEIEADLTDVKNSVAPPGPTSQQLMEMMYSGVPLPSSMPRARHGSNEQELIELAGYYSLQISRAQQSVEAAQQVILEFKRASGHTYWSPAFVKSLEMARRELWDSIMAGTVTAFGKTEIPKRDRVNLDNVLNGLPEPEADWQPIPPRWFWQDPPAIADLNSGFILRGSDSAKGSGPSRWNDVRFERPQIEALRPRLQSGKQEDKQPAPEGTHLTNRGDGATAPQIEQMVDILRKLITPETKYLPTEKEAERTLKERLGQQPKTRESVRQALKRLRAITGLEPKSGPRSTK